jgi:hypothetical protein
LVLGALVFVVLFLYIFFHVSTLMHVFRARDLIRC